MYVGKSVFTVLIAKNAKTQKIQKVNQGITLNSGVSTERGEAKGGRGGGGSVGYGRGKGEGEKKKNLETLRDNLSFDSCLIY